MTFTVYTICWNEAFLLPHFFKHYSFADKVVVYDNGSDDGSQELVAKLGGELRHYDTNNEQDNIAMTRVKDSCWKDATTDWVVVADVDEFFFGWERAEGYIGQPVVFACRNREMVSEIVPDDLTTITSWYHDTRWHTKYLCFSPKITSINYGPGCHWCRPNPPNKVRGLMYYQHYVNLSEDYLVARWQRYAPRMSKSDKDHGWASNYLLEEDEIRRIYRRRLRSAQLNS
jgi:glycosyltransferase involved in cell wall biosynthesis